MLKRRSAFLFTFLLSALVFAGTVLNPSQPTLQAAAAPVLVFSGLAEWHVTDGFIYLSDTCNDANAETEAYLRRRAINGPTIVSLREVDQKPQCRTFRHSAVDGSGVYYYNRNLGRLEAIYSDAPNESPTALATIGDWTKIGFGDGISALRLDANNVYWLETVYTGEFSPDQVAIKRVPKSGGVVKTLFSYNTASQTSFYGLGVTSQYIWWTDSNGLNRIDSCTLRPCAPGVPRVKTTEFPIASGDGRVQVSGSSVFWWNDDDSPEQIRLTKCHRITGNCTTSSLHTSGSGITINGLAANSSAAYWVEDVPLVGRRLMRKSFSGGAAEILVEGTGIRPFAPHLDVDGVYFQSSSNTISRLPFDAEAITREIGIAGWEVTQGVQRLANDVPLVAGKTTFVRLYPTLENGSDVGAATAALHASRNGEALPGSPIYPLNGTIAIRAGRTLADRSLESGGWLFQLPESWTRSGIDLIPQADTTLSLQGVIDPNGAYAGSDLPGNNEISGEFSFVAKAPTCITMRSVVTNNSYQSTFGINVGQVLELTESILPTPKLIAYPKNDPLREIDWCWKGPVYGPFCSTPYELSDDDTLLLTKMGWIDYWADSPSVCFYNNARTLLSGIVHDDAVWDWAGLARTGKDQLLTKVPRYGAPSPITRRNGTAMTMVHEIGHNYGRRHIDCGGPKNPDQNYPYPTDLIDLDLPLASPELHFGFDPLLRKPVIPSVTADYMSYCSPEWYSDYTWKALFNQTRDPIYVPPVRLASSEGDLVRVAGLIDTIASQGRLDPAWTLPVEAASEGQKQRWEAELTQAWDGSPGAGPYHLQLIGEDASVLVDKVVELSETEDGDPSALVPFALALSAPAAPVARLQLMENDALLDSLALGINPPALTIDPKIGGATIDREITIDFAASDPDGDQLFHTFQYSPNGIEWYPLRANVGDTGSISNTLRFDLSGEAGSEGASALIRVLSSDGFNTAISVSPPFSVAKRAPTVSITHPQADRAVEADENLPLQGIATDPEDGLIADERFVWSTGQTGQSASIDGLAPGMHDLELVATDLDGLEGSGNVSFTVAPLAVAETANPLALDGYCDDAGYLDASELPLSPYADGSRASAQIIHTGSWLWLCLSNLHEIDGFAGLLVDADDSGETLVQAADFGYFVKRDGTGFVREGNGSELLKADASLLSARISDAGTVWSAELRINRSAFGSWQQRSSLAMGHFAQAGEQAAVWPRSAELLSPQSWGQTNFGLAAMLTSVEPASAVLGTGNITLTLGGANFGVEHVVLWNGTAVPTALVDEDTLSAVVPSGSVESAGTYALAVGVTGAAGLSTAAYRYVVNHVQPTIASLAPNTSEAGSPAKALTINGTGFVNGTTVVWGGEPRATTYIGPTLLRVNIRADELTSAYSVPVVVRNPPPAQGPSNIEFFTISAVVPPTEPIPTATATASPIPSETATATANPTASPSQTSPAPTQAPSPTTDPLPSLTPLPTVTPSPEATSAPNVDIFLPMLSRAARF